MAINPYIARGVESPINNYLGGLQAGQQVVQQQQNNALAQRRTDLDERQINNTMARQDAAAAQDADEAEQRMVWDRVQAGDISALDVGVSKAAAKHPEFAQLAQQNPEMARKAVYAGLERQYGQEQRKQQAAIDLERERQSGDERTAKIKFGYDSQLENQRSANDMKQAEATAKLKTDQQADLSPEGLELAAQGYLTKGTLPTGMYRVPGAVTRIISKAAEMAAAQGDSAAATMLNQQAYKANQTAMSAVTKQKHMVGAFEKTAVKNLDLTLELSNKLDRSGSPIINRGLIAFRKGVSGDPETAAFVNALTAARTEYAKVLSGATGAQGITDSARHEANDLFNTASTPEQLQRVIQVAKQEMTNRMVSFDEQLAEFQPASAQPAQPAHPGSAPPAATPAARVRKYNPATGKIE